MEAASGAEGQWIADAREPVIKDPERFGAVAATIPDGYEAYARILHRVSGNAESELRWGAVAENKGTLIHPAVQFHRLAKILAEYTTEPQDIFQAVWDGWGGFEPGRPGRDSIPTGHGDALTVAGGLRKHWVFRGTMAELARPPWRNEETGLNTQPPNLAWPADRSWGLATEIDFNSTLVGGTVELIAAVVHSPVLEALEVNPFTDLSSEGDLVNIPPG